MNKTAIITGGGRGIGWAITEKLAQDGYDTAVLGSSDPARYSKTIEQLEKYGIKYKYYKCDIGNRESRETTIRAVVRDFGGIHVLVNNAGIAQQKLFTDITAEDWKQMFAVNVDGVFHCCQCALPDMIRRKYGKIINVSSMWGQVGASCEVHYSAAKAAVIGLTKALAKEVGPSGIEVNCIAPGVIDTPMNRNLNEETMRELKEETPLNMIGKPKDVANLALFLAEKKTRFITGQVLGINGGMVI